MANEAYKKLVEATKDGSKLDGYTLHSFAVAAESGQDVDKLSLPMLMCIYQGSFEKVKGKATIYSDLGGIIALSATPAQLLELIAMPEVQSFEASRPGGTFD
ncbi:MAG TPA: hypothetical protein VLH19_03530 [Patescibacteria group bacterium]|nr:hypothetical protein [Patescibacteria group bacterium]